MDITFEEYEEAERNGVNKRALEARIRYYGWDKRRAIETPLEEKNNRRYWAKVAEERGIKYGTFINRINLYGMTPEEASQRPLRSGRRRQSDTNQAIS